MLAVPIGGYERLSRSCCFCLGTETETKQSVRLRSSLAVTSLPLRLFSAVRSTPYSGLTPVHLRDDLLAPTTRPIPTGHSNHGGPSMVSAESEPRARPVDITSSANPYEPSPAVEKTPNLISAKIMAGTTTSLKIPTPATAQFQHCVLDALSVILQLCDP